MSVGTCLIAVVGKVTRQHNSNGTKRKVSSSKLYMTQVKCYSYPYTFTLRFNYVLNHHHQGEVNNWLAWSVKRCLEKSKINTTYV